MAKEILLTKGKSAIVSDEDYEWLMQWKWMVSSSRKRWYARSHVDKKVQLMHRVIVERYSTIPAGMEIDHINGDPLDNRRENLRVCTHSENIRNLKREFERSTAFKNVSWCNTTQRWVVGIDGSSRGKFRSSVIAAVFANDLLRQRDGAFAFLNDIPAHIELIARQVPFRMRGKRNPRQELAQLEHAERVEKAYSEWLIMKRITDWQAQHPARPSVTANGVNESTEAA